uniref:Uncharacterized protein n=1 Tax=Anguilla anguilla TaxID=7936 RepID=A0A0E9T914_ANGAN
MINILRHFPWILGHFPVFASSHIKYELALMPQIHK